MASISRTDLEKLIRQIASEVVSDFKKSSGRSIKSCGLQIDGFGNYCIPNVPLHEECTEIARILEKRIGAEVIAMPDSLRGCDSSNSKIIIR